MTEPPHHGQATVVISRHVAPGREREFQRWLGRLRRAVEAAPGYAGSSFHPPQADHPDEWLIVYRFVDVDHLDLWLASPTRASRRWCEPSWPTYPKRPNGRHDPRGRMADMTQEAA